VTSQSTVRWVFLVTDFMNLKIKLTQSFKGVVCIYVYIVDYLYVYKYIYLYCVSKKTLPYNLTRS
jgi:hypothetical protein